MTAVVVQTQTVGRWKQNCYLLSNGADAVIIDPGDDFDVLDSCFELSKVNLHAILITHGHFDHIGAVSSLQDKYKLPCYMHSLDRRIVGQANLFRRLAGASDLIPTPKIDHELDNLSSLDFGSLRMTVHHTPGHSKGSVCFEAYGQIFVGDLIFDDSLGRADLPGGDSVTLLESLRYLVDRFAGSICLPGHGKSFVLDPATLARVGAKVAGNY